MNKLLHILQHSLGVDKYGQGDQYRNHFCTGPGSTDYPTCREAVDAGLMVERENVAMYGGDSVFFVTPKGIDYVALNSPVPSPEPKLTRSQRRYREWLEADSGHSFAEWIGVR